MFWKRSKPIATEATTAKRVKQSKTREEVPGPALRIEALEQRFAPQFGSLPPDFDHSWPDRNWILPALCSPVAAAQETPHVP